jgi:Ca-activated chloride channel family protein
MTAVPDDDWLDQRLRQVAVPGDLVARLSRIAAPKDQELDDWLCNVPVPADLLDRLQAIAWHRPQQRRWQSLAAAAAWLLFFGLTYLGAMAAFILAAMAVPPRSLDAPISLVSRVSLPEESETLSTTEIVRLEPNEAVGSQFVEPTTSPLVGEPALLVEAEPAPRQLAGPALLTASNLVGWSDLPALALPDWQPVRRLAEDRGFLADISRHDQLPDLWALPPDRPRGVKPPLARGFDSLFLLAEKTHPVVGLRGSDPGLQTWPVPLASESTAFDLARRFLDRRQRPPADSIRVEDFLAAYDPELPPIPSGEDVALTLRAGATPFGVRHPQLPPAHVLQVGVRAREVRPQLRPATRLTVLVDCSSSMEREERLVRVQRALNSLIDRLGPADELSLLTYDEQAHVVFENGTRRFANNLKAAVRSLTIQDSSTNLAAGLELAYLVAASTPPDAARRQRVVVITDGGGLPGSAAMPRLTEAVSAARQNERIELAILHLGLLPMAPSGWQQLATAGGGRIVPLVTSNELAWGLAEQLTGQSQRVAARARLTVRFDPAAVLAYRVIGHEATDVALQGGPLEIDLLAGQTATGLFEVFLAPGTGGAIATATLTWHEPISGEKHEERTTIKADAFPVSWEQTADPVRRAIVTAQVAEILRGSFFARGRLISDVLTAAEELESASEDRAGFRRILTLARDAAEARNERAAGR